MIYNLLVVGNGIAAQAFLHELFNHLSIDVKKSQNFSIAQVFSEELAPGCSLRSSAAVSLNGIEDGVSLLGNTLRNAFFDFNNFMSGHHPEGVEKIKQIITFSNDQDKEKMLSRYKNINLIKNPLLLGDHYGVELDSFLVSPHIFSQWFEKQLNKVNVIRIKDFLKSITRDQDGIYHCQCLSGTILAQKIVFCSGAYASIFSSFFSHSETLQHTSVVSGAFLHKSADFNRDSFYITVDGHNLIYRDSDKSLTIGSASLKGNLLVGDIASLRNMHELFSKHTNVSLGEFKSFKVITGLRHKGRKRMPMATFLTEDKTQYMINGFYKNGYSYAHHFAKKAVAELLSH